ncbi:MAG: putative hemolysin [Candidatus Rokuibacteriota bacterium]
MRAAESTQLVERRRADLAGARQSASQHCLQQGGTLSIRKNGAGAEYGICSVPDNRQCEEWARLPGECPSGGIKVAGYVTAAARSCAISGGQYAVTGGSNTREEQGTLEWS